MHSGAAAVALLRQALFGLDNADVRAAAARALGLIDDPAAQEALQRASGDADPQVAKAAADALTDVFGMRGRFPTTHPTSANP
jgi:HEAT repeat protein